MTTIRTEQQKEWGRKYYLENKELVFQRTKNWKSRNKTKLKNFQKKYSLRKLYNLSVNEYENLVRKTNGKCCICNELLVFEARRTGKGAVIDHCHITGKVREIICRNCNYGIGLLQDDFHILERAFNYLKEHAN